MITIDKILSSESISSEGKEIDIFPVEWYEVRKRLIRRKTQNGTDVLLKRKDYTPLQNKDILYSGDNTLICVDIAPCQSISITPKDSLEMATLAYEIGNRHLPLFWNNGSLVVPYDKVLFAVLSKNNYNPEEVTTILQNPILTTFTVGEHSHSGNNSGGLLTKILDKIQ